MMTNSFKFSKGLIISIVYNVIILTLVKCDVLGTENNNKPPVPDYEPGGINDKNYFEYHFRSTYPGQFKQKPTSYFASKYNCAYIENEYTKRSEQLKNKYDLMIETESTLASAIEKTYESTKNAYEIIEGIENKSEMSEKDKFDYEFVILGDYLKSQISIHTEGSTIPVKYDEIDFYYVIKNYELYIEPTEEIFYRSSVIKEEISAIIETLGLFKNNLCHPLSEIEYDEVVFLYALLPNEDDDCNNYEAIKTLLTLVFQESFATPSLNYTYGSFFVNAVEFNTNKYYQTCYMLKNKFVVNNENFMSYLIRLKTQRSIGIHQDNHKFMYGVRINNYYPSFNEVKQTMSYAIDMDIHEENFKREMIKPIVPNRIQL